MTAIIEDPKNQNLKGLMGAIGWFNFLFNEFHALLS